jgi:ribonuclease HI
MLIARFDGACEPNPKGHSACACLITNEAGVEVHREWKYLGVGEGMTCNVAEFEGLMLILKWIGKQKLPVRVHIISDSMIVVRRMQGPVKKLTQGVCAQIAMDCQKANLRLPIRPTYEWQRRNNNEECDAMCSFEIDARSRKSFEGLPAWPQIQW